MKFQADKDAIVIGAGLTGSLLSMYLAQEGLNVSIFELRPDLRKVDLPAGRSINMALSHRGISALQKVGLFEQIKKDLIPMKGRCIHLKGQDSLHQAYGVDKDHVIYSISRGLLNKILLEASEKFPNIEKKFQYRCQWMNYETNMLFVEDLDHGREHSFHPNTVLATDGAFSAIRKSMIRQTRFSFSQQYIEYGYKEITIPAQNGAHVLDPHALHIWPREQYMLIALPNVDGSFTCTLFLPYKGEHSFQKLNTVEDCKVFFDQEFPDLQEYAYDMAQQYVDHPIGDLLTLSSHPWNISGQSMLLGDAAHCMLPFFGQGMNAAFEDCVLLHKELEKHDFDFSKAYSEFWPQRKKDTDAISKMALDNFSEMRSRVRNPDFHKRKAIEHHLERIYPELYQSLYSKVSFSLQPYHKILDQELHQTMLIDQILEKNIDCSSPSTQLESMLRNIRKS
ncbi:MAG: FAD-dependent monooxygenase [Bdellovibrionales bacterium]|nr:FAD-dependent monooxygenase [Bdellovibrionales bacterium]